MAERVVPFSIRRYVLAAAPIALLGLAAVPLPAGSSRNTTLLADMNCDGVVNILDVNPFVLALANPAGYASAFPTCKIANGDINGDGALDILDVNPFVVCVQNNGNPCP